MLGVKLNKRKNKYRKQNYNEIDKKRKRRDKKQILKQIPAQQHC